MSSIRAHTKRKKVKGGIAGLIKRVKTAGTVDVGVIDAGSHVDSDLTVASIADINEFGLGVPERSFMRSTTKEQKKNIVSLQKKLLVKIQNGEMDVETALGLIGEFTADKISQKIVSLRTPPNAPETIARKGSSNPLVDTGQLKNSITYEVNR